jgi:hypothetical protein
MYLRYQNIMIKRKREIIDPIKFDLADKLFSHFYLFANANN